MATSAYPTFARQDPRTQVIAHSALKVAQAGSMIFPPLYLVSSLILRRGPGFSIRGLLRVGNRSVIGGAAVGGAAAWARLRNEPMEAIEDRCYRLAHSATQIHTDDYSLIGASLAGVVVPALFLKRAPLVHLVTGGASIGLGIGSWTHIAGMFSKGQDVRPEGMVGEIPIVGGNDKK